MDVRRLLTSFAITFVLFFTFMKFIGPALFPGLFPKAPVRQEAVAALDEGVKPAADAAPPEDLPAFESRTVTLGSTDPESGYRMKVTLSSEGAAVTAVEMSDPRYRTVDDREKPLRVVGNVENPPVHTFALLSDEVDAVLSAGGDRLRGVPWEVVPDSLTEDSVAFRYPVPGGLELTKTFKLRKSDDRLDAGGYMLDVSLTAFNPEEQAEPLSYWWQGPVGVPLESLDSSRAAFVTLKGGVLEDPADPEDVDVSELTAGEIVEAKESAQTPRWASDFRWVGPDVQYFAAFAVAPEGEPTLDFVKAVVPTLVQKADPAIHSNVSMVMRAEPVSVPAGESVTHAFRAYFGPKKKDLLAQFGADDAIAFGWFGSISRLMLNVLSFFHDTVGLPYALAIMALTCCVRLCLMPITLKVAASGERMKEMQPKIEELRKKHGDDKEALGKAQMELMMKEGNPLAGCLPLLLQFPIFIGLYAALQNTVDLRLAEFLWADNLAAPDHLAKLPVRLPFLGEYFNLLPLVVVGLFLAQQKMFMPEAVSDEQKAQYRIMNFMMLFMGFMFYSVPAGLCVYFIASSLWSITERTAIKRKWIKLPAKKQKKEKPPGRFRQFLAAKMEEAQLAADAARAQQQGQSHPTNRRPDRKTNPDRRDAFGGGSGKPKGTDGRKTRKKR